MVKNAPQYDFHAPFLLRSSSFPPILQIYDQNFTEKKMYWETIQNGVHIGLSRWVIGELVCVDPFEKDVGEDFESLKPEQEEGIEEMIIRLLKSFIDLLIELLQTWSSHFVALSSEAGVLY